MTLHRFPCDICGQDKEHENDLTTGYGELPDGRKACFACCADRDRDAMLTTGKATLYLTQSNPARWYEITNWPGTLKFSARNVRRFRHPFAREAWLGEFTGPDGKLWRFKNIGDTQIAHCRRAST